LEPDLQTHTWTGKGKKERKGGKKEKKRGEKREREEWERRGALFEKNVMLISSMDDYSSQNWDEDFCSTLFYGLLHA
jgi:hypothetical protein